LTARTESGSRTAGRALNGSFCALIVATAAVYIALFAYFVARTAVHAPVYDLLDWVVAFIQHQHQHQHSGDWAGYLWMPHNEHRVVWSRALLAIDLQWFGSAGPAFLVFGSVLLAVVVTLLVREIVETSSSHTAKLVAASAVVVCLLPSTIATMCSMPAMQVFLHQAAFAALAIVAAARGGHAGIMLSWPPLSARGWGEVAGFWSGPCWRTLFGIDGDGPSPRWSRARCWGASTCRGCQFRRSSRLAACSS
jgi:hypothetical protein